MFIYLNGWLVFNNKSFINQFHCAIYIVISIFLLYNIIIKLPFNEIFNTIKKIHAKFLKFHDER